MKHPLPLLVDGYPNSAKGDMGWLDALRSEIAVLDAQGRIVQVNAAWREFAEANGARVSEVIEGASYLDVCMRAAEVGADPFASEILAGLRGVLSGELPRFEAEYPCHSVEVEQWFSVTFVPLEKGSNRFLAVHENLSESRRSPSQGRILAKAVEQMPVGVVVTDPAGVITYANPASYALTGYTPAELTGQHTRLLKSGHHDQAFYQELWGTISGGGTWRGRMHNRRKDGSLYWETATICPVAGPDQSLSHYIAIKEDITAQVEAERLLDEARQQTLELAEHSRTVHWRVDAAGLFTEVSPVVETVCGYRPEELEGKLHFYDLHPPAGRDAFRDEALAMFARHEPFGSLVNPVCHKDGRVLWMNTHGVPLLHPDGTLAGYQGTDTDMTGQKEAQDALGEAMAELSGFFDVTPDLICVASLDGRLSKVNRAWEDVLGYPVAELEGTSFLDLVHPDDVAPTRAALNDLGADRNIFNFINRYRCRDGSWRHLEWRSHPHGSLVYGAARDVTERIRLEAKLRDDELAYRQLFDCNPMPMFVYERATLRIIAVNDATVAHYGFTEAELLERTILDFHDPSEHEVIRINVENIPGPIRRLGELKHYRRDGTSLTVEVTTHDLVYRGKPARLVLANDITERKHLERQFLRAQRMESIGTLAGGIAHNLNNILAPIVMSIDLLAMRNTDPASQETLATIAASAKRGADIVRQVLSFARGIEGERIEVQVKHLVKDMESIAIETFPKNIELRTRLSRDLWTVLGDPTQLHQVLLNLCVNARDAMPDGGTLTMTAENVNVDEQFAAMNLEAHIGPHVFLTVEDTGTGIAPEVVDKIFDLFFTTKAPGKGTGLGLATTLGIVKAHGGFIRVYSEPGKGTRFKVALPAHRPGSAAETFVLDEPSLPRGQGELVLVVDDEASVRDITRQTLEAFGYRVITAHDGADAVALYAQHRAEIAVVLTDMMMPIMDGPSAIRVLQRLNPEVRIIAASGIASQGMMARPSDLGVEHFLPKPYTADTLLVLLRLVLDR